LLHQGESNTGELTWPSKVQKVYENFLSDLNLKASEVPLLAGGVVPADQNGKCAVMNEIIAKQTNTNIVDVNPLSYNWEKEMIHIANSLCK
jgi:hypothetical protein